MCSIFAASLLVCAQSLLPPWLLLLCSIFAASLAAAAMCLASVNGWQQATQPRGTQDSSTEGTRVPHGSAEFPEKTGSPFPDKLQRHQSVGKDTKEWAKTEQ